MGSKNILPAGVQYDTQKAKQKSGLQILMQDWNTLPEIGEFN